MAHDWALDFAGIGIEPPATADEIEEAAAHAAPARPAMVVEEREASALSFAEVDTFSLTDREREIYEAGFFAGFLSRQPEVDSIENAFKRADDDANRYYRDAFDHDYHDCAVHENRGRYPGAKTRVLDDAWGDNWDASYSPRR